MVALSVKTSIIIDVRLSRPTFSDVFEQIFSKLPHDVVYRHKNQCYSNFEVLLKRNYGQKRKRKTFYGTND